MKNLFLLIASFFIIGTAFSQSYNVIPGKNEFTDTMKLRKLKNNAGLNYILSTDTAGRIIKVINPNGTPFCTTTLLSGSVIWVNGFNFSNTKLTYQIGCQLDTASAGNFSITEADTIPRYTIVWADTLGNIGTTDGVYSGGIAQIPNVNPNSQILLATYFIPANSSEPLNLSNTAVYKENVEWVGYTNIPGGLFNYTINPYQGLVSTYLPTWSNTQYVEWRDGTDYLKSDFAYLSFYIRLSTPLVSPSGIAVGLANASGWVGYYSLFSGSGGFNGSLLNSWQLVVIPISSLTPVGVSNTFNDVFLQFYGAGGGAIQIDNVILQSGGNNVSTTGVQSVNGATNHVYIRQKYNYDSSYSLLEINGVVQPDSLKMRISHLFDSTGTEIVQIGVDSFAILATGGGSANVVDSIWRELGKDSILYSINGRLRSVKDSVGGGSGSGVSKAQVPLLINVAGDSITRRWNVRDYLPGFISGVTDCTAGIQACINACDAGGGGEVFFPNGIYIIGGAINATYNSQIYIPYVAATSVSRSHITLMGETKPNMIPMGGPLNTGTPMPPPTGGVILKTTLTTFTTPGQSVIGTRNGGANIYNETFLSVENIAIQIKNNPSGTGPVVGGISYKNGGSLQTRNVTVYIDTNSLRSTMAHNDVVGIETPDNSAETMNSIENTLVGGLRTGFKIGEHTSMNQAQAMVCYYGFNMKDGYHTTASLRSNAFWCAYDIYVSGFCTLSNFQFDSEWLQQGKWYDDVATIKDSANLATGQIFYTIMEGLVGKDDSKFIKIGGDSLHTATNGSGVATLDSPNVFKDVQYLKKAAQSLRWFDGTTPKWSMGRAADGSFNDFFLYDHASSKYSYYISPGTMDLNGTGSSASISMDASKNVGFNNSAFYYKGSNGYVGIGTGSSPLAPFHIKAAFASGYGQSSISSVSGTGDGAIIYQSYRDASDTRLMVMGLAHYLGGADPNYYFANEISGGGVIFRNSSANTFELASSGALRLNAYTAGALTTDGSGNVTATSDRRVKHNIKPFTYGLKAILGLKTSSFIYNQDKSNTVMNGFIAQDVQAVIPTAVHKANDKIGTLSLETNAILAASVNAIQEQQAQIEDLKKANLLQQKKMDNMEKQIKLLLLKK